jgi:hypothetical protein
MADDKTECQACRGRVNADPHGRCPLCGTPLDEANPYLSGSYRRGDIVRRADLPVIATSLTVLGIFGTFAYFVLPPAATLTLLVVIPVFVVIWVTEPRPPTASLMTSLPKVLGWMFGLSVLVGGTMLVLVASGWFVFSFKLAKFLVLGAGAAAAALFKART